MSLFADDRVMYLSGNNWPVIQRRMQQDLDSIVGWTFSSSLSLNHGKTKAMMFSTRGRLSHLVDPQPFSIYDKKIGFVANHTYLGIILGTTMSLVPFIKDFLIKKNKEISNF